MCCFGEEIWGLVLFSDYEPMLKSQGQIRYLFCHHLTIECLGTQMRSRGAFFNIIEIFNPLLRYNGRTQGTVLCVLLILAFLLPITISQIISYFQHRDRPLCCTLLRNAIIRKWKTFGLCNRNLDRTIRIVYDVFATYTSTYSDNKWYYVARMIKQHRGRFSVFFLSWHFCYQ